jgi:hypothetical protein
MLKKSNPFCSTLNEADSSERDGSAKTAYINTDVARIETRIFEKKRKIKRKEEMVQMFVFMHILTWFGLQQKTTKYNKKHFCKNRVK